MARSYRLQKRAETRDQTRERIVQATMQLHDEQGVAMTSFPQIAERAGVGAATIYRHFATVGELVSACGRHVWQEMQPPVPDLAPAVFAGIGPRKERLQRLIAELDAFYARGELRLSLAAMDRERVPELNGFLGAVEGGVEALVREALGGEEPETAVKVVVTLAGFPVWAALKRQFPPGESARLRLRLFECAIAAGRAEG